ncbi:MAG: carotenoid biosynthesis protein [Bacteroidota bacterium]
MEKIDKWSRYAVLFLAIFHLIGITGLHLDIKPEILNGQSVKELFQSLVPLNLLLTISIVLLFHKPWNQRTAIYLFVVFWIGYLVELIGVRTGAIFGDYVYGEALGIKVAGIPPMIGVNWVLLIYLTGCIAQGFSANLWVGAAIGSSLMIALDLLIEPMAIRYDFWTWSGGEIPLLNFFGWFVISYLLHLGFYYVESKPDNPIAKSVYVIQLLFFGMFWVISMAS